MLNSFLSIGVPAFKAGGNGTLQGLTCNGAVSQIRPLHPGQGRDAKRSRGQQPAGISLPTVDVAPHRAVSRRGTQWHGMAAEFVKATSHERVDYHFRSSPHVLAVYEQGVRRDGESWVEGIPRSTLRNVAGKLTFVPAGHAYREWHDPRIPANVTYFYLDPAELQIDAGQGVAETLLAPRLFFEDATIRATAAKLSHAIDAPGGASRLYVEALGVVLIHELIRLNRGTPRADVAVRGGLAAWQQRIVSAYVEEHLSEQIPLAMLARLARLSTFHFCRAFKQSFGVPPHRYHTTRRIERAKLMLAERKHSVTEIGLTLGFSETSSFTAMFRKFTGQTPSRYHRALG